MPGLRALKVGSELEGMGGLLGKRGLFRGPEESLVNSALVKYPKQLEQYSKLMNEQLEKAIKSHENQIAKHQTYLNNSKSRVPQWENLSKQHQENLIHHWRQDISRHEAYSNIGQEILRQRKEELPKNGW